jgi:hypothetical protein
VGRSLAHTAAEKGREEMLRRLVVMLGIMGTLFALPVGDAHAGAMQCSTVRARTIAFNSGTVVAIGVGTYDRCWDGTNVYPNQHGVLAVLKDSWTFPGLVGFRQYGAPGSPTFGQCDQFNFVNTATGEVEQPWLCVTLHGDGTYDARSGNHSTRR